MRYLANEVSGILKDIGKMECEAVKVASDEASLETQTTVAIASSALYDQLVKEANDRIDADGPMYLKLPVLLDKLAAALNADGLDLHTRVKIAAVVHTDSVLTDCMSKEATDAELHKLAETRAYGREYFVNILQRVL
jgi:hypothetical protein